MAGTLRNLRATATAETSNMEQGFKRLASSVRGVGTAAEEASRRGSRAMDDLGRRGGVSMGVLSAGGRNAVSGLLQLGDVAGSTAGRVGGLVSTMVTGFAGGGMIGVGIAAVTGALSLLGASSEKSREAAERLRREQEQAAEAAKRQAEQARDAAARKAEDLQRLREEIELLNARTKAEERTIANRIALRRAGEKSPEHAAMETERQAAEERRRRREARDESERAAEAAANREAEQRAELDRRQAEAQRAKVDALVEQARQEHEVLTLTREQLEAKRQQQVIQDLINAGKREEAEALRQAIEYARQQKEAEEGGKADQRQAEETRREDERRLEARRRLSKAADEEAQKLRNERALLAAGTEELRKREERRQREVELIKQYGVEAMKVIQAQRQFWAEEDAREVKRKADAEAAVAKQAKADRKKGSRADSGRPTTDLEEYDPASGVGPNTWLRGQKKAQRQYDKHRRNLRNLKAERRGMGRRRDDEADFSGARMDDPDLPGEAAPGARQGPKAPAGAAAPAPGFPMPPLPSITESGEGAPSDRRGEAPAVDALKETAAATQATSQALAQLDATAKEAAAGAKQAAEAAGALEAPARELVTGLSEATEGLGQVQTTVTEAVTGVTAVVKAVNDLNAQVARMKAALDLLQKVA